MKILFIGGGNMASAMIGGMLARGEAASAIGVVELNPEARASLASRFGVAVFAEAAEPAREAEAIVIAVKPQQMQALARQLGASLSTQLVISIAAGIRLADLSRWLGNYPKLVRAMPNTPALVRAGVTGLFATETVDPAARRLTEEIMTAIGSWFWVPVETMMDAVTAVSGSGPAYVFYFLEALESGALQSGFDAPSARQMALDTVLGAARLAAEGGEAFAILRQKVTSKGGTTEAALNAMKAHAVGEGIVRGMQAAEARSQALGEQLARDL
jgi:pyrroline-5-carboxylate reductase